MTTSSNNMVSHTSIYMFGDVLRYSVSLIMLPVYTRYLTPEDYGVIELLSMLIDFVAIIFGSRVGLSVFRFYCTADTEKEKNTVIASALFLGIVFNGLGTIFVALFSEPLANTIFSDRALSSYIALFSIIILLMPLNEIPLAHMRAQKKPWLFFCLSFMKLALQVGLNVYFVVFREMHVEGVIYSAVITGIIMAFISTAYSVSKAGIKISVSTCRNLFSFSFPLKLATIGSFYLTFGDRYILNMYTDLSQVGLYALGYKFGFIFTLLAWTPFEKMWDSEKYLVHKRPEAKRTYQNVFLYISVILVLIGLCISIFSKDLLKIMSDPAFFEAYRIVPVIILAYLFQAWTKYCDFGLLLKKKTIHVAYAEAIAVAVITIAYFMLIPEYGMYGAAWATVIGFAVRFYWTNRMSRMFYDMDLPWKKVNFTVLLAILAFLLSYLVPEDLLISITLRTSIVLLFIVLFFALPILTREDKSDIYDRARKLVNLQRKTA